MKKFVSWLVAKPATASIVFSTVGIGILGLLVWQAGIVGFFLGTLLWIVAGLHLLSAVLNFMQNSLKGTDLERLLQEK